MHPRRQVGAYAGCAALIGVLLYWFNPAGAGDCSFNTAVVVVTIVLCVGITMAPLHPSVRPKQCFAKCPFTCQFDWLSDQLCQSLDRLSDHFAKRCPQRTVALSVPPVAR